MTSTNTLTGVIAEHVAAVNAGDLDAIVATFADDAYVNDARREFRGRDAIRRFLEKEIIGDNITMDVREVIEHYGDTIVRAAYEGDFDRTNLPDGDVVLTNYLSVRDGKIISLVTILNRPADY
jgi:SnoaL-like domain